MGYLLDTNIISDLVRDAQGRVASRIRTIDAGEIVTSIIVAAELRFGALKRNAKRLATRIEGVLEVIPVLPLETPADRIYARLRSSLERRGLAIGGNDLLIAAHTVALGHTLVTANEREFARITELRYENWLAG